MLVFTDVASLATVIGAVFDAALHLGLTGWVANNWDGSVTLEAQGERAALDALVPLIERSNRWARIENVEVTPLPVKEHEYGFGERSGE